MFGFVLARPRVRDRLQAQLGRVLEMVRLDLEQTEVLFQRNRARLHRFCRFGPAPAAGLGWVQTLQQRALEALRAFGAVQHLCVDPGQARLVLARLGRVLELLLGLRGALRADWSLQLDSDCSLVLDHVLLEGGGPGPLRVGCLHKVEEVLRAFRCVRRGGGVELRPHAARLLARRDDITQSCLRLGHMVSCYNQVVSGALQVELPVIQEQLLELDRKLAPLKKGTWSSKGVQQEQTEGVLRVFSSVQEARANMATMTRITQVSHSGLSVRRPG
ncbi:dynein axonemal heavy chain 17-like [Menidia menidia]